MLKWLSWIGANGPKIIASGVLIGLIIPPLATVMKPTLTALIFAIVVGSIIRVDFDQAKQTILKPVNLTLGLVFIMGILPAILLGLLWLGLSDLLTPGVALGLLFMAGTSPINSTPALAALLGLNTGLALTITIFGMGLAPFTLFALISQVDLGEISFDPFDMFIRLSLMIAVCFAAALILRKFIGLEKLNANAKALDGINVLLMLGYAIGIMDGVTASFIDNPAYMLNIAACAIAGSVLMLIVTSLVFWPRDKMVAATIGFAAANPNTGIIIGAVGLLLPQDTWFFFAMLQFPIYLMPALLKPVYLQVLAANKMRVT